MELVRALSCPCTIRDLLLQIKFISIKFILKKY